VRTFRGKRPPRYREARFTRETAQPGLIGYAALNILTGELKRGLVSDPAAIFSESDPVIAFNPEADTTNPFLLVGMVAPTGGGGFLGLTRYSPESDEWNPWQPLPAQVDYDKPWIEAGELTSSGQEFYILAGRQDRQYLRSMDGGQTWVSGLVDLELPGVLANIQPAVAGAGPLYASYVRLNQGGQGGSMEIGFLRSVDLPDGTMRFFELQEPPFLRGPLPGPPLVVTLNRSAVWKPEAPVEWWVPSKTDWVGPQRAWTLPQLAADPTHPSRLYLVYHDTPDSESTNFNIYLQVLTRLGAYWSAGQRVLVNNDDVPYEADQFQPQIKVDEYGNIHIIFVDDRNYNELSDQLDGPQGPPGPYYDVFYAWAYRPDSGQNPDFTLPDSNFELCLDPGVGCVGTPPLLDYGADPLTAFTFGEYFGIDYRNNQIWTSFNGVGYDPGYEPTADLSAIWSSRIDWQP
jgi:hypothetical protein